MVVRIAHTVKLVVLRSGPLLEANIGSPGDNTIFDNVGRRWWQCWKLKRHQGYPRHGEGWDWAHGYDYISYLRP